MKVSKRWSRIVAPALVIIAGTGQALAAQLLPVEDDAEQEAEVLVKGMNVRFHARAVRGLAAGARQGQGPIAHGKDVHGERGAPGGLQINDAALDHIQTFAGTRPFEFSIQSETSVASFGKNIVVGYNSSADSPIVQLPAGLFFEHVHFSAYSTSNDGGQSWTSGFIPPPEGSLETDGDPSLAVDRRGNFYYASLGSDAAGTFSLIVGKSTDGGRTFAPAVVVAADDGSDKEWLAIGPDPVQRKQDNLYVTWTSFQATGSELRFSRSTDGGATWSPQQALFVPTDTGAMSAFIQFSNPIVDRSSGRLYIPFLHFSNSDADLIRVLVSDDAGATFHFLRFDIAGAPDPFGFPNVTPGLITDCGNPGGGIRIVLRQGPDLGGGRLALPRYRQATRLITQPSAAAANGRLFIALNSSTSATIGDPAAGSQIRLLYTLNGGTKWSVRTIAPATSRDPQHVHPSVSVDDDGEHVQVGYYTQQADERLRTDLLLAEVGGKGLEIEDVHALSRGAFDLIPSNIPLPSAATPFRTTNYDRLVQPCYNIGEYMSVVLAGKGKPSAQSAWGDNRQLWTSPPGSPLFGTALETHAQPDVFFTTSNDH